MKRQISKGQALKKIREWEQKNLRKHGWIVHYVIDDPGPTGANIHTHGLHNFGHPDFQIVVPLPQTVAHDILINLVDRVKAGEQFQAGQKVDKVIRAFSVKMIEATECGRPILRVIIPDPEGNVDLGKISDPFVKQYDGVAVEL